MSFVPLALDLDGRRVLCVGGAELVHTATGVADVDAAVAAAAGERRLWCIDATNAERATAHVLVHREADGVTVAVHSHGDPRRSRAVADRVVALLEGTEPRCMDPLSR